MTDPSPDLRLSIVHVSTITLLMRISLFILIIIFEHNQFTPISGDVWIETEGFVFNKDGGLQHCIQDEQLSDSQLESSFRVELDCL